MSGHRRLFEECARGDGDVAGHALAIVLETEGSTYVRAGGMALFGDDGLQLGWLSGGCLEPEIALRARDAVRAARIDWLEIDTRDDEDLLSGSAVGCRGRLRIVLLPLRRLPGRGRAFADWNGGGAALEIAVGACGDVSLRTPSFAQAWRVDAAPCDWPGETKAWRLSIAPPPEVRVFGAGPETPLLLPLLRDLGWRTTLVERRARWIGQAALADAHVDALPAAAVGGARIDAALVMHHHFELDREALSALAGGAAGYVGLLGPVRRREDLFRVLPERDRERLSSRLRSPVGLDLGGHGAAAIALSIAAQLQAWRHDAMP